MKSISSKYFHFLLNGFDSKIVPILQNMGVGTVTQIQAFSSSIANLEFSTKIWRNDEPKELGSTTFVTKIWTRVPHPNPYECWLHAPNVGSSSTLFVPNKKSIRGCDAIEKKCSAFFPLSARHSRDNFLTSFVTTHSYAVRALTALHSFSNAFAFSNFLPLAPAGCSDKTIRRDEKKLRFFSHSSTSFVIKLNQYIVQFWTWNRYTISNNLLHKSN